MSTITKEWLLQKIADMEAARDEIPFGLDDDDNNTLAALRIALASLEAEPVAWRSLYYENHGLLTGSKNVLASWQKQGWECEPLYTAHPAPASVPDEDLLHMAASAIEDLLSNKNRSGAGLWADVPAKLRRAAMLQGAEKAESTTTMQNAPALDSSPKIAESRCSNSPVIPDGWALVPVEPTEDMIVNGFESEPDESFSDEKEWEAYDAMSGCQQAAHRAKLCWAAMIKAAPKLE